MTVSPGTEIVAAHTAPPLAAAPAVTVRRTEHGAAWYVGVGLDHGSLSRLLGRVVAEAGVAPVIGVDGGSASEVDVTRRRAGDDSWVFVLNHGPHDVSVDAAGHDLVTDQPVDGPLRVGAGGCAVIREAR